MGHNRREATEMTDNDYWKPLGQLQGGLKLFLHKKRNKISFADQSGYFPDWTEDRELWFDDTRSVVINFEENIISFPVSKTGDIRNYWVTVEFFNSIEDFIQWTKGFGYELRFTYNGDDSPLKDRIIAMLNLSAHNKEQYA